MGHECLESVLLFMHGLMGYGIRVEEARDVVLLLTYFMRLYDLRVWLGEGEVARQLFAEDTVCVADVLGSMRLQW